MIAETLLSATLAAAGYEGEPTEENVRDMFADYVGSGYFSNINVEDIPDITTEEICFHFVKISKKCI